MSFKNILISDQERVRTITINRPAKLNALNRSTLEELRDAFDDCATDDSVRCIVLTGAGDKAFVAGADIGEIRDLNENDARAFSRFGQDTLRRLETLGKPSIAAINGFALGGGFELALACSLRIASEKAKMGLPEISLGIMPGFGGTQRLARITGAGNASYLALTGQQIDAARAFALGIVSQMHKAEDLELATEKLARGLAANAHLAMAGILKAIDRGLQLPLEESLTLETDRFAALCGTADMREGTAAFLEKRKPEFE